MHLVQELNAGTVCMYVSMYVCVYVSVWLSIKIKGSYCTLPCVSSLNTLHLLSTSARYVYAGIFLSLLLIILMINYSTCIIADTHI